MHPSKRPPDRRSRRGGIRSARPPARDSTGHAQGTHYRPPPGPPGLLLAPPSHPPAALLPPCARPVRVSGPSSSPCLRRVVARCTLAPAHRKLRRLLLPSP